MRTIPARPSRLASLAEAAAYADISTCALRRYIADGRLPCYRVGPRLMKVDLSDLEYLVVRPIPAANDHIAIKPSAGA